MNNNNYTLIIKDEVVKKYFPIGVYIINQKQIISLRYTRILYKKIYKMYLKISYICILINNIIYIIK